MQKFEEKSIDKLINEKLEAIDDILDEIENIVEGIDNTNDMIKDVNDFKRRLSYDNLLTSELEEFINNYMKYHN